MENGAGGRKGRAYNLLSGLLLRRLENQGGYPEFTSVSSSGSAGTRTSPLEMEIIRK